VLALLYGLYTYMLRSPATSWAGARWR
jgi:hypothetical protein